MGILSKCYLQSTVHETRHQVELLVLQHGLVADDVLSQLAAQRQSGGAGLESSQHCRESLEGVADLVLEYAAYTVPHHLNND